MAGSGEPAELRSAVTGDVVALASSRGLDFAAMARFAREQGGPASGQYTFHQRAALLKALAEALTARKQELYELSYETGATKGDTWIDVDGGIGTFAVYQSKGRRELPNDRILIDGNVEGLSKGGTFQGLHVFTSLQGVAVHINAFNFPSGACSRSSAPRCWPACRRSSSRQPPRAIWLRPAVRILMSAGVLPPGALQLVAGRGRRPVRPSQLSGVGLLHGLRGDRRQAANPSGDRPRKCAFHRRA